MSKSMAVASHSFSPEVSRLRKKYLDTKPRKPPGYLKIPSLGIPMPELNTIVKSWFSNDLTDHSIEKKKQLAFELFKGQYSEDKQAGVSTLVLLKKELSRKDIPYFEQLFDEKFIADWSATDSICTKVIRHMIMADNSIAADVINWKTDEYEWKVRASLIPFVVLAKHGDKNFKGFNKLLYETCATTIVRQERFIQLATGWLLREMGLSDHSGVVAFIEKNMVHFTSEGLRYAVEKMEPKLQKKLRDLRSEVHNSMADSSPKSGVKRGRVVDHDETEPPAKRRRSRRN